ncbi:hypothetical protein K2F43_12590 [Clostridium estertheticum]|uniref:hypothetical protein n=1 Tax=Clostridium estertheticum TaxID=238834 RepID=UPI001C6E86D1|nr:hypothetical protein [Clostridium estertheticum]MBW9172043.1 hypothetical protein [Clostridium estertheticum]WLC73674.1 hypothetical protein KTC99_12810 [Clostridium estertheticum]
MKLLKKALSVSTIFILLTLILVGCSAKQKAVIPEKAVIAEKNTLEFGSFAGTKYTQPTFGMSLNIPEKWSVMDDKTRNSLYNASIKVIAKDDAAKKTLDLSKEKSVFMFFVSQKHYSANVSSGSNIIFQTENLGLAGNIVVKTGKEYLEITKTNMSKLTNMKYTFEDTKAEKIAGKDFYTLKAAITLKNGAKINQTYYCYIDKGYALTFINTYSGDKQADAELDTIMKSMKFN